MKSTQIVGHERVIESLKRQIKNNKVSHSYLFEGKEGLGKKQVALRFAKTLLCKEKGQVPCNRCTSCIKFESNSHPDLIVIEPENGIIKIKTIRDLLINGVNTAPFESSRKIFVIDDSHKMKTETSNALLKTLEEPPEYINIILVTSESNKMLSTILSRCQSIKFHSIEVDKIKQLLIKSYGKDEEQAKLISNFASGSVGKAVMIAKSEEFFQKRDEIINIIDGLLKGDRTLAFSSYIFFNDNKDIIDEIFDMCLIYFRDLMIYKKIGDSPLIINKDKIEYLSSESTIDSQRINGIMEKIQQTKENIKGNVNFQLSIETMLLNIGGN